MASLACETVVHVPPQRAYDFLTDFEGYAAYSEYLEAVERDGDGGPGTEYAITASWWRLSHTVRSAVTAVDPPERIDWRLRGAVDARGAWLVDDLEEETSRVTLAVAYDPATMKRLDLPYVPSVDWLADRLAPVVEDEARAVVERIVADLEGEHREVEFSVRSPANVELPTET